jgi:hypothetical protein
VATSRFNEYLERITSLTNTVSDNTESISAFNVGAAAQSQQAKRVDNLQLISSINKNAAAIAALSKKIKDLELLSTLAPNLSGFTRQLTVISVDADYTSVGNEVVICTNTVPITITLSPTANNLDETRVLKQSAGLVTVAGNINGETSIDIVFQYDAPTFVYTLEAGEYSIL